MSKINIGSNVFPCPMPMALVGAQVEGKPGFLAVAWVNRVNMRPPILAVAVGKSQYTLSGIEAHRTFSVNFPGADLVAETDYCGITSGRTTDKGTLFDVFYGELKTAPMITQCPLCIECKLFDTMVLPTNVLYLGEIANAYTEERFRTAGKLDIKKINPFVLSMPDNNYWSLGEQIGGAWEIGRTIDK